MSSPIELLSMAISCYFFMTVLVSVLMVLEVMTSGAGAGVVLVVGGDSAVVVGSSRGAGGRWWY